MINYEQKYKEALERARRINNGDGVPAPPNYSICETIFPELKESEDEENIRKEIVDYLRKFIPHVDDDLVAKSKVWIAWLEKQGENIKDRVQPQLKWKKAKEDRVVPNWVIKLNKDGNITVSDVIYKGEYFIILQSLDTLPKEE